MDPIGFLRPDHYNVVCCRVKNAWVARLLPRVRLCRHDHAAALVGAGLLGSHGQPKSGGIGGTALRGVRRSFCTSDRVQ